MKKPASKATKPKAMTFRLPAAFPERLRRAAARRTIARGEGRVTTTDLVIEAIEAILALEEKRPAAPARQRVA